MSSSWEAWSDEELIEYMLAHSKTDLALFHPKMASRLVRLAGDPNHECVVLDALPDMHMVCIDEVTASQICDLINARVHKS